MKKIIALLAILALAGAPIALAGETIWDMAESDQYGEKAGGMFGRGLLNASTCFVDLIVQTVDGTKEGPPLVGTLAGLGGGIACTALRATSGVLDVGTFWVPGFNGFPVSKSYSNCLEAERAARTARQQAVTYQEPVRTYSPPVQQKTQADVYARVAKSPTYPDTSKQTRTVQKTHDPMEYVKK